jgi:DNA uptake protein ComE-like DNA-binding protein
MMRRIQVIGGLLLIAVAFAACSSSQSAPTSLPAATRAAVPPTAAPISPANVVTATPELSRSLPATNAANSDAAPTVVIIPSFAKLNLNTAEGDDYLEAIPGFGNRMVREFLEYRPYVSIQQFRKELGKYVDAATVAEYEKFVYVPVDVNESDAATLEQIPGVTAEIAAQMIAARPFESNDEFLAILSAHLEPDDVTHAQNYLATP